MMKGYAFCPNCFQTGTYNGYICKACGYIQEQKDKYALPPGTQLKRAVFARKSAGCRQVLVSPILLLILRPEDCAP